MCLFGLQTLSIIINKNYIVFEKEQNFQFLFKLTIHFQEIPPPKKKNAKTLITDIQDIQGHTKTYKDCFVHCVLWLNIISGSVFS